MNAMTGVAAALTVSTNDKLRLPLVGTGISTAPAAVSKGAAA